MRAAHRSDVGRVRPRNEDSLLDDQERRLFVVADGIGGHPAGDVASRTAIAALDTRLTPERLGDGDLLAELADALRAAHDAVLNRAGREPDKRGMGTTAVVAHVSGDERMLTLAHIGDSRAYLQRSDRLRRITEDHVTSSDGGSLSQAIGPTRQIEPDTAEIPLERHDRVLLCTDGLTDMLPDEDIESLIVEGGSPHDLCKRLVDAALERGGVDNVTAIVIELD